MLKSFEPNGSVKHRPRYGWHTAVKWAQLQGLPNRSRSVGSTQVKAVASCTTGSSVARHLGLVRYNAGLRWMPIRKGDVDSLLNALIF